MVIIHCIQNKKVSDRSLKFSGEIKELCFAAYVRNISDNVYYTIQGTKTLHPVKGIYTSKGKKIVVK